MTQQPIKSNTLRNRAMDYVENLSSEAHHNRTDIHFSEDVLVNWLVEFAETYAASKQVGEENRRLREAAKELLHLHSCEQEGLQSGKPTFEMWFNAVNKLSEALESVSGRE